MDAPSGIDPDEPTRITMDLRVDEMLCLSPDTVLEGDVHAPEGVILPERVTVEGDVYTDGPVELGPDCRVEGDIQPSDPDRADEAQTPARLDVGPDTLNHRVRGIDDGAHPIADDGETQRSPEFAARTTDNPATPWSPHAVCTLLERMLANEPATRIERIGPYAALVHIGPDEPHAPGIEGLVRDVATRMRPDATVQRLDEPSPGPAGASPLLVSL